MQELFNNLYRGTQSVGDDGYKKGRGLGAFIMQQVVDEDKLNEEAQKRLNQQRATSQGESLSDLTGVSGTSSVYDVDGAIISTQREREKKNEEEAERRLTERTKLSQQPQLEATRASTEVAQQTLAATIANNNATNSRLMQQGAQSHQLALMQMADNAEARAQELAYQKMRDRKADMQYNERMEQLDRKDRRQAMSSIAAGLASLGAAFAM